MRRKRANQPSQANQNQQEVKAMQNIPIEQFLEQLPKSQQPTIQLNWMAVNNSVEEPDKFGLFRIRMPSEVVYFKPPITFFVVKIAYRFIRQEAERTIYLSNIFDYNTIKPMKRDGTPFTDKDYDKSKDTYQFLLFGIVVDSDNGRFIPVVFPLKNSSLKSLYDFKRQTGLKSVVYKFLKISTQLQKNGAVKYYVPIFELADMKEVPVAFVDVVKSFMDDVNDYIRAFNENFGSPPTQEDHPNGLNSAEGQETNEDNDIGIEL